MKTVLALLLALSFSFTDSHADSRKDHCRVLKIGKDQYEVTRERLRFTRDNPHDLPVVCPWIRGFQIEIMNRASLAAAALVREFNNKSCQGRIFTSSRCNKRVTATTSADELRIIFEDQKLALTAMCNAHELSDVGEANHFLRRFSDDSHLILAHYSSVLNGGLCKE